MLECSNSTPDGYQSHTKTVHVSGYLLGYPNLFDLSLLRDWSRAQTLWWAADVRLGTRPQGTSSHGLPWIDEKM